MKNANITVTVKTVPHSDPQRLIDLWSRIVLKELLEREKDEQDKKLAPQLYC